MAGGDGEAEDEISAMSVCISEIPSQSINQSRIHASLSLKARMNEPHDISIFQGHKRP